MNDKYMNPLHVPSLYVRVYRRETSCRGRPPRSLTICEGVSSVRFRFSVLIMVPSLYVRVYRCLVSSSPSTSCSLTICEGVSFCLRAVFVSV